MENNPFDYENFYKRFENQILNEENFYQKRKALANLVFEIRVNYNHNEIATVEGLPENNYEILRYNVLEINNLIKHISENYFPDEI